MESKPDIRLTQYSHGAGCGCKIAPKVLDEMLISNIATIPDEKLLVGNDSRDDAAVYDLGNGEAIISTTDFFMPIVDDPFDFGRIAATNAISDIYAMGGSPLVAIAILGWPVNTLPASVAQQVIEGGRQACKEAGILLAGGHSIDNPEPIFGLAVTGRVAIPKLKRNDTAKEGSILFLTKPLGVGVLATAQKKGKLLPEHQFTARDSMVQLNTIGEQIAELSYVSAMTDVTGFGLLGHLREMCDGSSLSAHLAYDKVPVIDCIPHYLAEGCVPGGTKRNWASYGDRVAPMPEDFRSILCDPQTSGGLLVAVDADQAADFKAFAKKAGYILEPIGNLVAKKEFAIYVQ